MSDTAARKAVTAAVRGRVLRSLPRGLRPSGRLVVAVQTDTTTIVCLTTGSEWQASGWYQTATGWDRLDVTGTTDLDKVGEIAARMARRLG
jgi:hypothetical protein